MPSYPTYKLGDVAEIINGKNQKEVVSLQGEYPIYGSGGIIGRATDYLCKENSTIIGRKGTIDSPIFVNQKFWNVDTAFGIQPSDKILPRYLFFFCKSFDFKKLDKSTTIPSLAKRDLLQIPIPLPPLPTQHQIVSRIESLFAELDKAVEHLRTAQQQLKTYRQAVLNHWLNNEDGKWEKKTAEECVVDENYSLAIGPFGSDLKVEDYTESGVKLVFVRDITSKFKDKKNKFVSEYKADQLKAHNVFKGDLLITKMGDPPGQTGIFPFDRGVITSDVLRMKTNDKILNKYYAMYYILSSEGGKQIKEMTQGVAQKKISLGRFKKFLFPVPEISEQQRIVKEIETRLSQAEAAEARIAEALQKTESLRQSILKKAFSGEFDL